MNSIIEIKIYLPSTMTLENSDKHFLIKIIYHVNFDMWWKLRRKHNEVLQKRKFKDEAEIEIVASIYKMIVNYQPLSKIF